MFKKFVLNQSTTHQMARYMAGSGSTLILKIILNEVFMALGVVAWLAYLMTQIAITGYTYIVHSLFTFKAEISIDRFWRYVMSVLMIKIADYVLFNVFFYGGSENSVVSIVIATVLMWMARFFAIRKTLVMPEEEKAMVVDEDVRRIAVIGGTISGNRGAEAMLCTVIGELKSRQPGIKIELFSYYPEDDSRLVTDSDIQVHSCKPLDLVLKVVPLSMLAFIFRHVGLSSLIKYFPADVYGLYKSELLLDIAGVSFIDGREKFLPFNIASILPAMLLGVPVVKLAQAMGPFENKINHLCAQWFLRRCKAAFARGDKTYSHLQQLDPQGEWIQRADDVAFCYDDTYSLSSENEVYVNAKLNENIANIKHFGPIIGICPSSLVGSKGFENDKSPYIDQIDSTMRSLLADGKNVLLFPNATRAESSKFRNNDIKIIRILAKRFESSPSGPGRLEIIDQDINTKSIRAFIRQCDLVIVSRFHAMIAALSLGVPCIVLGWSHKYFEVMKSFGLQDYVFPYTDFESEKVIGLVSGVLEKRQILSQEIMKAGESAKRRSQDQFDWVHKVLVSNADSCEATNLKEAAKLN